MAKLLSKKSVATKCDVTARTITRWVKEGSFPAADATLPGGGLRWYEHTVEMWLCRRMNVDPCQPPVKGKSGGDK